MDSPREQRNRVHLDVTVADDEGAGARSGGTRCDGWLVDDSHVRAFWVLSDVEGNEVCVCTWQDRD